MYEPRTSARGAGVGPDPVLFMVIFLAVLTGLWIGTQFVAHQLGYHPNLGASMFSLPEEWHGLMAFGAALLVVLASGALVHRGFRRFVVPLVLAAVLLFVLQLGPIYAPIRIVRWWTVYKDIPEIRPVLDQAGLSGAGAAFASMLGAMVGLGNRRKRVASGAHGTARWGSGDELIQAEGFILGRRLNDGKLLRYSGDGHLITLAPTRTGKGVAAVMPNLLDYPGSLFAVDPKPELAAVTARRRREMGQEVRIIDLLGSGIGRDGINPLDFIDLSTPKAIDVARALADELVDDLHETGPKDPHWNEQASGFIAAVMLFIKATARPEEQNLPYLRELITLPEGTPEAPGPFADLIAKMMDCKASGGLIAREAATLWSIPHKERGSVLSTARRHTRFLDMPLLGQAISRSTFRLADLKRKAMSVYVCLPVEDLPVYFRAVKLLIYCTSRAIKITPGKPERKVLGMIEEFQNLGRLKSLETDLSLVGGFGMQYWLIVQDIPRLKAVYKDSWETFFTNTDVLQAFGASNDKTTPEYLSWLTGEATVFVDAEQANQGVSHGKMSSSQRGKGTTTSEMARRLLKPDEVRRMPKTEELLFIKGMDPIRAKKANYLTDREFRSETGRPFFDPNPHHAVAA